MIVKKENEDHFLSGTKGFLCVCLRKGLVTEAFLFNESTVLDRLYYYFCLNMFIVQVFINACNYTVIKTVVNMLE